MSTLTTLEVSLAFVALEFGAIALSFGLLLRKRSIATVETAQKETEAAIEFAEAVVEKEPSRRDALELIFREKYNLDEETISARAEEFVKRERAFYQTLIATFAQRDSEALPDIGDQLNQVVAPWISLVPQGMVSEDQITDLNQEKESLTAELEHNKSVLEELMTEYDRAFHKDKVLQGEAGETAAQTPQEQGAAEDIDLFAEDGDVLVEPGAPEGAPPVDSANPATNDEDSEDDLDLDLSPGAVADDDTQDAAGGTVGDEEVDEDEEDLVIDAGGEGERDEDDLAIEAGEAHSTEDSADNDELMPLNAGEIDDLLESLDSEPA